MQRMLCWQTLWNYNFVQSLFVTINIYHTEFIKENLKNPYICISKLVIENWEFGYNATYENLVFQINGYTRNDNICRYFLFHITMTSYGKLRGICQLVFTNKALMNELMRLMCFRATNLALAILIPSCPQNYFVVNSVNMIYAKISSIPICCKWHIFVATDASFVKIWLKPGDMYVPCTFRFQMSLI